MQSKLAANRFISCLTHKRVSPFWLSRSSSSTTSRTADPSIHAGEPEGVDAEQAVRHKLAQEKEERVPDGKNQPPPKPASIASSPKFESSEIQSPNPLKQQKRHYQQKPDFKDVSCGGVDGFPENGGDKGMSAEDENREYYKDHKPSPISEVEFADTRTPMTQATDGSLSNKDVGAAGGIITFTKEQSESAEETLMKSMRIWRESAMRGDPDAPHSRALRAALLARGDHDIVRDLEMGIDY
ncbi:hypothetical protein ACHQM5_026369 [Ranunculus cassubicifolius]